MIPHIWFRIAFSLLGAGLLAWYLLAPAEIVARFDVMALGLLALCALPWLALLVEEFKIGGVEAKLRAIREEAEDAVEAASAAREVAEELALARPAQVTPQIPPVALSDVPDGLSVIRPGSAAPAPDDPFASPPEAPKAETPNAPSDVAVLDAIAKDYIDTRAVLRPGPARTAQMTTIFAAMQDVARKLGPDNQDMHAWLRSDDSGRQLAAIAWLRSFPDAMPPSACIAAIENATEPFVQYWALRALSGRIDAYGLAGLSVADRRKLRDLNSFFTKGNDRHSQAVRINRKLDSAIQT